MERLLGFPLRESFNLLLKEPVFYLKYLLTFWWLKLTTRKKRLHPYEPSNHQDLEKNGVLVPPMEQLLEPPKAQLDPHMTESVLIYGGHTNGSRLAARVCRERGGHVSWLHLVMPDGRSYKLPHLEKSYPHVKDFWAGGLRIKCLTPMRKWRLSYSGLLRESKDGEGSRRVVFVKFSFLCISTSFAFDLSTDLHPSVMAEFLVRESETPWPTHPKRLTRYLDRYVQAASILGTVSVAGGEEEELHLWGAKHRATDFQTCRLGNTSLFEFLGHTKEGQLVYAGEFSLPGFRSKLTVGHLVERNGFSWPTKMCKQEFTDKEPVFSGMNINIVTERTSVAIEADLPSLSLLCPSGVSTGHTTLTHLTNFRFKDGDTGYALIMEHNWRHSWPELQLEGPAWQLSEFTGPPVTISGNSLLVLGLDEEPCRNPNLSGGKGASLSTLTHLQRKYETNFKVPDGFVITTEAYGEFSKKNGLQNTIRDLENSARSLNTAQLQEVCAKVVTKVSKLKLPPQVEERIRSQFLNRFPEGGDFMTKKRFAVRSSASGEDSEDMSAAGQLSTFLAIQGLDKILESVPKCFASQFSFAAIQYKRQYGQELNSPMAVVVQEMVPADVAGVLFTCDPLTGDPQNITITANYGLGESVVSALAEPDTLVVQMNEDGNLARKSLALGKKKLKVQLTAVGDAVEMSVSDKDSKVCCISMDKAKIVVEASLKIEETYGFPIDVEWALVGNVLYLLQARPITTFDQESKHELTHSVTSGLRAEDEYNTKANGGEVMSGAISHLGLTYMFHYFQVKLHALYAHRNPYCFPFHPFQNILPSAYSQIFISMPYFVMRFFKLGEESLLAESFILSGFGRPLDDPEMLYLLDRRNRTYPTTYIPYQMLFIIKDLIFAERVLKRYIAKTWKKEIDLSKCATSKEMYLEIWKRSLETIGASTTHFVNTLNSSIYNSMVMAILAKANKGWDTKVYSDVAYILSSCGNVDSVDIPLSIQLLSKEIEASIDVEKFKRMDLKDAIKWLETTSTSAGGQFKEFMRKHGHRSTKEYDVFSIPWRMNKTPLVKILQDSVGLNTDYGKDVISVDEVIKNLQVPLGYKEKLLLKILIPFSRKGVMNREMSKTLIIKQTDFARKGFWELAEQLVKEGRLPDNELMFFLSDHELMELIETRSPALVRSAIRRRRIFPELDLLRFPEITRGVPMPIVTTKDDLKNLASDFEMKGTPVGRGVVKGTARVATSLAEAESIQPGEILIAYSTDIAWSPYFPILGGVATELGGLISHGAVVAREYGLPCVVGLHGATDNFKTGDLVFLDGDQGVLKRIDVQA